MSISIALAGNPNCGKTTLFNRLTGENGYVGNWPGVTVEKKQGPWRANRDVIITDLPGIYSLSPYSPEEIVSRDYLVNDRPDVVVNLVDATNLERNLYLTTQIVELGLPVVVGLNMSDLLKKNGDKVNAAALAKDLGCPVVECSALKGDGVDDLMKTAVEAAKAKQPASPIVDLGKNVEDAISKIEAVVGSSLPTASKRWYEIKLLEGDEKATETLGLNASQKGEIAKIKAGVEKAADDDAESVVTMARYDQIGEIIPHFITKAPKKETTTEKIDKVVTNRWLGLPIFVLVMVFVYWIAVSTVGTWGTDWANDGLFGDGWHLPFTGGAAAYEEAVEEAGWGEEYADYGDQIAGFIAAAEEAGVDTEGLLDEGGEFDYESDAIEGFVLAAKEAGVTATVPFMDADGNYVGADDEPLLADADDNFVDADGNVVVDAEGNIVDGAALTMMEVDADAFEAAVANPEPDPADYPVWVPGVPVVVGDFLNGIGVEEGSWVWSLVIDGVIAGVGAVLGFVPQMIVLFMMLCLLEDCGYLARVAFILDRIFRRFGLSGKSFIPMLISSGCGVPGVMATKAIENEPERRMTTITTTMVPCGAKLPIIALIMGALIGTASAWWIAPLFYFMGIAAVIISGIMLKKTKWFAGDVSPFIMELPAYHLPSLRSWLLHVWERVKAFIVKAGTIIFASTIVIWLLSNFGWDVATGQFGMLDPDVELPEGVTSYMDGSILAKICTPLSFIFIPLGFGGPQLAYEWQATAMSLIGLTAKENVVSTFAVLFSLGDLGENNTLMWSAFGNQMLNGSIGAVLAFGAFNLLCAPCFAAIGTIRRQMNSGKWFWFAIGYLCIFAWVVGCIIYQLYMLFTGGGFGFWTIVAFVLLGLIIFQLFRPMPDRDKK